MRIKHDITYAEDMLRTLDTTCRKRLSLFFLLKEGIDGFTKRLIIQLAFLTRERISLPYFLFTLPRNFSACTIEIRIWIIIFYTIDKS